MFNNAQHHMHHPSLIHHIQSQTHSNSGNLLKKARAAPDGLQEKPWRAQLLRTLWNSKPRPCHDGTWPRAWVCSVLDELGSHMVSQKREMFFMSGRRNLSYGKPPKKGRNVHQYLSLLITSLGFHTASYHYLSLFITVLSILFFPIYIYLYMSHYITISLAYQYVSLVITILGSNVDWIMLTGNP